MTRYWVGGSGTWDATAGTKWSTSSGGVGGASVPTAADDVIFDANSGSGTVTLATGQSCLTLDFTGFTGTFSHLSNVALTVAGNLYKLSAGMTFNTTAGGTTARIDFTSTSGTCLITTAGKSLCSMAFNGAGGTFQLQDALTTLSTHTISLTSGTLDTNGQACSWGFFISSNSNIRTLTLGASLITITGASGSHWDMGTSTNLTFNAGTSLITINNTSTMAFNGGGKTYYDVIFNHPSTGIGGTITGANTFRNFTYNLTGSTSTSGSSPNIGNDFTVTGTLTINGFSAQGRATFVSTVAGSPRTITAAAVSLSYVDFIDIVAAGAAAPFSGTSIGDGGGNSGITFTTPVNRYVVAAGSWSLTTVWSATSGGASGASIPLPQDNVFLDANSGVGTSSRNMVNAGKSIDCTGYTGTLAITQSGSNIFGNLTLNATMTLTWSANTTFRGRGTHTITTAGKSFSGAITFSGAGGSYTLQDSFSSSSSLTVNAGTFDANGFNITCTSFSSSTSSTRTVNMGSGTWTISGIGTVWNTNTTTNLTLNAGSSLVVISDTSTSSKSISQGAIVFNDVTVTPGGTGVVSFGSNFRVNNFTITGGAKTVQFANAANALIVSGNLTLNGSDASNLVTLRSTVATSQFTITKTSGLVVGSFLSILDSNAIGGATFIAGRTSTNAGNNSGWQFVDYFFKSVTDSYSLSDIKTIILAHIFTDSLSISDTLAKTARKVYTEAFNLADYFSKKILKTRSDLFPISDKVSTSITKTYNDSITLADSLSRFTRKALSESFSIIEKFIKRLLYRYPYSSKDSPYIKLKKYDDNP